jgi:L-threonylcarbamoyladenylate synthase
MILYPTETIYALGVNALDENELAALFAFKGRDERQTVSWLVRDMADVANYAEVSEVAARLAARFLPGPLTLVLPAKSTVPTSRSAPDGTIGFRISPDPVAQRVIVEFMAIHDAPLTCTSANLSGLPTLRTPQEILKQFGDKASRIDTVIDDGIRAGAPSTVVRVIGDTVEVLREGAIAKELFVA